MSDFKIQAKLNSKSTNNTEYSGVKYTPQYLNETADSISFSGAKRARKKGLAKRIAAGTAAALYAVSCLFIPSCHKNKKDDAPDSAIVQTVDNQDTEQEIPHTHSATVITTPHKSVNYIYVPRGGSNSGDLNVVVDLDDYSTLDTVVKENFAKINDNNVYSVALDQAKANSNMVLSTINKELGTNYTDVADIPSYELLNTPLNKEGAEGKAITLVNSTHEDFKMGNDGMSEIAYVNQEKFISDNPYVVIDPNWDGVTPDSEGRPIYKTVEDAVLSNYRTQKTEEDHKLIESRWTDAYTDCLDAIRDDEENMDLFKGMSRDEALLQLKKTDFNEKMVLHMADVDAQRVSLGCDDHGAKENITNGHDYRFSYLQSSVDKIDIQQKDENDEYIYKTMYDLMKFYGDPSDEMENNGKTLLDRYNEDNNDAETLAYILTAVNNIIRNEKAIDSETYYIDGKDIKGSDLTAKQALQISLLDKDGNPITDYIMLGDAAYNILGDSEENVYINYPKVATPRKVTPKAPPVVSLPPADTPVETPPTVIIIPDVPTPTPDEPIITPEPTLEPTPEPTTEPDEPTPTPTPDEPTPTPKPTPTIDIELDTDSDNDTDPTPTPKPTPKPGGGGGGGHRPVDTDSDSDSDIDPTPTPTPDPGPIPSDNPQEGVDTDSDGDSDIDDIDPRPSDNPQEGIDTDSDSDSDIDPTPTPTPTPDPGPGPTPKPNPGGDVNPGDNPQEGIDTDSDNDTDNDRPIGPTPTPNPNPNPNPNPTPGGSDINTGDNPQEGIDTDSDSDSDFPIGPAPTPTPTPSDTDSDSDTDTDIDTGNNPQEGIDTGNSNSDLIINKPGSSNPPEDQPDPNPPTSGGSDPVDRPDPNPPSGGSDEPSTPSTPSEPVPAPDPIDTGDNPQSGVDSDSGLNTSSDPFEGLSSISVDDIFYED